jgi:uncharacterized protein
MSATNDPGANVQRDWANREFIQGVQYNVMKIADFLNKFDISTRYRLAKINERLVSLERQMDFLEASIGRSKPEETSQWERILDPASNQYYLRNVQTGETKWENS